MTTPLRIDIWSDFACPWCFLGKRKFEAALQDFDRIPVEIVWRSYQLNPDMEEDFIGDRTSYLREKLGWSEAQMAESDARLKDLGEAFGIDYNFADNKITNTHLAHELLHFAASQGRQNEMADALFRANFTDGEVVSNIETLVEIAESLGLDEDDAQQALESGHFSDAVEEDKELGAKIGVNGVPFFVLQGKYAISGAQDPDTFLRALTQVAQEEGL